MSTPDAAPGRRERKKREVKQRLIEAGTKLLSEKTLEEVTIDMLCEMADISRKTFYNHFPSKQDLIEEISQQLLLAVSDQNYQTAIQEYDTTRDRLLYFLAAQGKNLSDNIMLEQNLIKHAMLDMSIDSERSRKKLESSIIIFEKLFLEGQKLGDVNNKYSARFLAEMVSGIINTSAIHWIHFPDYPLNKRYKELIAFIQDIVLA